ncbi:MAG TPA: class I SAM-dependent methyltransferase [Methylosinus sp.]|jgi:SAM-dependent methyltransferase|uniref:class I SAM-dependent methyltransferase n=1 Tax=Methylosinus sp. TaxID=427 RepID=UPI002F924092
MDKHVTVRVKSGRAMSWPPTDDEHSIAFAYNQAGESYESYADGGADELFAFDGQHAFGDRTIWSILDGKLRALRSSGARSVRILDLGCGPGTWLCRVVMRASELGFTSIQARGIDIAETQVRRASARGRRLAIAGLELAFESGDICAQQPEASLSVDLCLCLYGVLNHIPIDHMPNLLSEVARVTRGDFIATMRAKGSMPTICVDAIEEARWFWHDHRNDLLEAELQNGRHISFGFHLFDADEIRALSAPSFEMTELRGLDLFHGRFAGDRRWNPSSARTSAGFLRELDRLEHLYCRDPEFLDHATHLLFVATPRNVVSRSNTCDTRVSHRTR